MKKYLGITMVLSLCLIAAASVSAAAEAPGTRVLDSLKDAYAPVTFDHPKHVSCSCSAVITGCLRRAVQARRALNHQIFKNSITTPSWRANRQR
jgi:hypothetical protein